MRFAITGVVAALISTTAQPHEINERLRGPVSFVAHSAKTPDQLELCVANTLSAIAIAAGFHDGPNRIVVTGTMSPILKVIAAVELNGDASGTKIVAHIFGKGWNGRLERDMAVCW